MTIDPNSSGVFNCVEVLKLNNLVSDSRVPAGSSTLSLLSADSMSWTVRRLAASASLSIHTLMAGVRLPLILTVLTPSIVANRSTKFLSA